MKTYTLVLLSWGSLGFTPAGPQRPVASGERGVNGEDKATPLNRRRRSTACMRGVRVLCCCVAVVAFIGVFGCWVVFVSIRWL